VAGSHLRHTPMSAPELQQKIQDKGKFTL